jgi:hypothetical protein
MLGSMIIKSAIKNLPYIREIISERDRLHSELVALKKSALKKTLALPPESSLKLIKDKAKAHHVVTYIAKLINARKCFFLTATTTGNPALDNVYISTFDTFISTKYSSDVDIKSKRARHQDIGLALSTIRRNGSFDISFVDPYHTYKESFSVIKEALAYLEGDGWMVVHDCFPPYELTADIFQEGHWCGTTFAAFRDVASTTDRAWFVINADFGLGIIGPKGTSENIKDTVQALLKSRWALADVEKKRELFKHHGVELMRVISVDDMDALIDAILNKKEFDCRQIANV